MPTLRALSVLLFTIAFAVSPILSPGFNGFDPDRYPVPQIDPAAQPAGYAFAIWGLIYLALIAHAVWGLWKRRDDPTWDEGRLPLIVSLGVGAIWLPVAQVSPVAATIMIFVMLAGALVALSRSVPAPDFWMMNLPLGLYAGWLTAASFVSVALLGAGYGVIWGETGWAVVSLSLTVIVASAFIGRTGWVPFYVAALIWALIAVIIANLGSNWTIAMVAAIGIVIVAAILSSVRHQRG
ncbi:MFS family permease [Rubricella aquisinus]|uniref:MFS family permease n=1 Tax=Rubricella aquisinus TaxID=2028108 RepID=A0A840X110_9RHOB|nr:hypothetical protein [Rubricella aquisinus]MBB5516404.1 MFS family permease [Rubricella aquisinus]